MASIHDRNGSWRVRLHINGKRFSKSFKSRDLAEAWAESMETSHTSIFHLRAAIEDHRIATALPAKFRNAIKTANYSASEIIQCSVPLHGGVGIYFLIDTTEVVYVGQTNCILRRLDRHRRDGKQFTSFTYIPCMPEHLDELEQTYITLLMPSCNATFGGEKGMRGSKRWRENDAAKKAA